MATDLLTPVCRGATRDLARGLVFRKQILPEAEIAYEGRRLRFDRAYLDDLVTAFEDAAYDQVPFVLATRDNEHTMDPERMRGEITGVSLAHPDEAPGLYATISFPTPEAASAVLANPALGVSCRIKEGVVKADGRAYGKALVHVCGTLDPRVTGMSPWRKVDLSGYDERAEQIDLSTRDYAEVTVAKSKTKSKDQTGGEVDLSVLTDEELSAIAAKLGITDEDIAKLLDGEPDDSDEGDEEEEEASAPAAPPVPPAPPQDHTAGPGSSIDLAAREQAVAARERADEALAALAQTSWEARRDGLIAKGIPPHYVNLCEPVFNRPYGLTVDLTNGKGDPYDVQGLVGQLLDGLAGYVDLAGETGHAGQFDQQSTADPDQPLLDQWSREFPAI
jgi:hypothetical protein